MEYLTAVREVVRFEVGSGVHICTQILFFIVSAFQCGSGHSSQDFLRPLLLAFINLIFGAGIPARLTLSILMPRV